MTPTDVRPAALAGRFYPAPADALRRLVDGLLRQVDATPAPARAAIVPHAALEYSGACAAHVFARVIIPDTVVILAPNHTGRVGAPHGASLWRHGAFQTPLGEVPVAGAFADALAARCPYVTHDPVAHRFEHAIEVELPFLQVLAPGAAVVPLVLAHDAWPLCQALATALADAVRSWPDDVLLVASSDMTHHEPADRAGVKDDLALAAIARLDAVALLETCRRERITMCGRAPAAVAVEAARRLGAAKGEIVDYRHSGHVTGDDSSVVAYAGVVIR